MAVAHGLHIIDIPIGEPGHKPDKNARLDFRPYAAPNCVQSEPFIAHIKIKNHECVNMHPFMSYRHEPHEEDKHPVANLVCNLTIWPLAKCQGEPLTQMVDIWAPQNYGICGNAVYDMHAGRSAKYQCEVRKPQHHEYTSEEPVMPPATVTQNQVMSEVVTTMTTAVDVEEPSTTTMTMGTQVTTTMTTTVMGTAQAEKRQEDASFSLVWVSSAFAA